MSALAVALGLVIGCEQMGQFTQQEAPLPSAEPLPAGDPAVMEAASDVDLIEDPVVTAPADWDGTGILKPTTGEDARGAPGWTDIEAEVVDREGQRYLLATGVAQGIDNPSLAQQTAENRARAVLANYLNSKRLVNSRIVGTWQDASTGAVYARAEIEVPTTFMPKNLPAPRK